MDYDAIYNQDQDVHATIEGEKQRQAEGLELIPSENYASKAVLEANGSEFTNKYSEGYPGARYYGGQEFTDMVERIAIDRTKELFGAQFVNVQPLSGAIANLAAYFALMEPGDTILGMDLSHGGHLTHGSPMTVASKLFNFIRYKMKDVETGEIDYDELRALAHKHKPKVVLAGFSAYSRNLDWGKFVDIAREVGAVPMADISHIAGLIAGKALKNPLDYGFDIVTTTTHKTLRGPRGGMILVRDNAELAKRVDKAVFPGLQGGPHMHTIAAKAVAFGEALHPSFADYAKQVIKNAKAMEDVLRNHMRLIGGGTDNHLLLADVTPLGVTGGEAEKLLDRVGITLNKNMIPDDSRKPMDPSGIRFGTPAMTSRGFGTTECARVAELMLEALRNKDDDAKLDAIHEEVRGLAAKFPIPESYV